MKKVCRFWGTIAFSAIFLCLFWFCSEILRLKTGGEIDMVHSFYEVEEDTVDVLALGSSHMYYSFQPNLLWEEYGMTAYALGSPQQSLAMSYFLLKEALRYQKPKVVLLESYYFFSEKLYNDEGKLRLAFDGMKNGGVKHEMIETLLPELSIKEKLSWYIPFLKYHNRWEKLKNSDFHRKSYLRGGKLDTGVYENKDRGVDIPEREIPEICLEYFEKIVGLCEENEIELLVYATPYSTSEKSYLYRQGTTLALEKYLQEKQIPFLFLQKSKEPEIDFQTDFCDWAHLNLNGQKKVTSYLGRYIAEHYDITDHRGDMAYVSYEQDYQMYLKDVQEGNITADDENG